MSTTLEALSRFQSMTRTTSVIVRIATWACFILAGGCILATIVVGALPDGAFGELTGSFDFRQGTTNILTFGPSEAPEKIPLKAALIIIFMAGAPMCAWGGFFFLPISRILGSTLKGRPFDPRCAGSLRVLALCVGLYSVAGWVSQCLAMAAAGFFPELADRMSSRFGYDITTLLMAALLLVLSGVFKYGAELQRDADGTV